MTSLLRTVGAALLTLAALLLVACGSDSGGDKKSTIEKPKTAVICPEGGSWDANALLGKQESEAESLAKEKGCTMRVTERDGKGLAATMDLRPDRVNVSVDGGTVVKVTGVG